MADGSRTRGQFIKDFQHQWISGKMGPSICSWYVLVKRNFRPTVRPRYCEAVHGSITARPQPAKTASVARWDLIGMSHVLPPADAHSVMRAVDPLLLRAGRAANSLRVKWIAIRASQMLQT